MLTACISNLHQQKFMLKKKLLFAVRKQPFIYIYLCLYAY